MAKKYLVHLSDDARTPLLALTTRGHGLGPPTAPCPHGTAS